jgi:hypothetical protein
MCALVDRNKVQLIGLGGPDLEHFKLIEVCKEPHSVVAVRFQQSSTYNVIDKQAEGYLWAAVCSDKTIHIFSKE